MYAVYHGPEGLKRIAERVASLHRGARRRPRADSAGTRARRDRLRHDHGRHRRRDRRSCFERAAAAGMNLRRYPDGATRARHHARRDDDARRHRRALARVRRRTARRCPTSRALRARHRAADPRRPAPHHAVPHPSGLQPPSQRDRDAALPAQPRRQGPRARPLDDPARLVHDEAERDQRDDPDHLARVRAHPSVRAGRPARRLRRAAPPARAWLCEATGYAGVSLQPNAGSQGEYAGPARDPRLARLARRSASQRSA